MSDLASLLSSFRQAAVTEREKGTYFEEQGEFQLPSMEGGTI